MKISPFIVLASIILLAGCEEIDSEDVNSESISDEKKDVTLVKLDDGTRVTLVKLDDGTRCVVYSGYRKGGISCDWN